MVTLLSLANNCIGKVLTLPLPAQTAPKVLDCCRAVVIGICLHASLRPIAVPMAKVSVLVKNHAFAACTQACLRVSGGDGGGRGRERILPPLQFVAATSGAADAFSQQHGWPWAQGVASMCS